MGLQGFVGFAIHREQDVDDDPVGNANIFDVGLIGFSAEPGRVDFPDGVKECQAFNEARAVVPVERNQNTHVLRGTHDAIETHGMPAYQDVAYPMALQTPADLDQVVLHGSGTSPGVCVPSPHPWHRRRLACRERPRAAGSPARRANVSWHPDARRAPWLPGAWRQVPAIGYCRRCASIDPSGSSLSSPSCLLRGQHACSGARVTIILEKVFHPRNNTNFQQVANMLPFSQWMKVRAESMASLQPNGA